MYLFIILSFFLLTRSLKIEPKFCVNCRYFIKPEDGIKNEFGRCSKFPFENPKNLVDGTIRKDDYLYCSTVRALEKCCGKNAINYKKKYTRKLENTNVVEKKKNIIEKQ
jgi:hypothetical protein